MARNPSSKNRLSFNAGEYSPFLDNRVDIERASAAARRMENFIAEVEGPARRRPGLRFVAQIGNNRLCNLTFHTNEGYGVLCGLEPFLPFDGSDGISYLTKTLRGETKYYNYWPWNDSIDTADELAGITSWINDPDGEPTVNGPSTLGIQTIFSGDATYDPADECSLDNSLLMERYTNGNPYPFVMSYGFGPSYESASISDAYINDVFGFPPGFAGIVVHGYNVIDVNGPTSRDFRALGITTYGNQLGSHTIIGIVRETLSEEWTPFDQAGIDGGSVDSTRESSFSTFNPETREYAGSFSAFSFVKPDAYNVLGTNYTVYYAIRKTTGSTVEDLTWSYSYVGTGVSGQTLRIALPVWDGSTTAFVGNCVDIIETNYDFDDFDRLDETGWTMGPVPAWRGWDNAGWIGCGTPSTISVDSFSDAQLALEDLNIIINGVDTGHCWGDPWFFQQSGEDVCWDDFQAKSSASSIVIWEGGIGWSQLGFFGISDGERASDDFEDYTEGAATTWGESPEGWDNAGWFDTTDNPLSEDDFEENAEETLVVWDTGSGWVYDGWVDTTSP